MAKQRLHSQTKVSISAKPTIFACMGKGHANGNRYKREFFYEDFHGEGVKYDINSNILQKGGKEANLLDEWFSFIIWLTVIFCII